MRWRSVASLFERGRKRSRDAEQELASAYRAVFGGTGSREDAEVVLADLARFSGYYRVTPAERAGDLAYAEGMRAVYGRIRGFLTMTDEIERYLEEAARYESVVDAREGVI